MFVLRYLKGRILPVQSEVLYQTNQNVDADLDRVKVQLKGRLHGHSVLSEARWATPRHDAFYQPETLFFDIPLSASVLETGRDVAMVRKEAAGICQKLLEPADRQVFTLAQVFESMRPDVADLFTTLRLNLLVKLNDPARKVAMTKTEITALLIGEILALEAAGAAGGVQVAGAVAKIKSMLEIMIREVGGSKTSVVETEDTYVGETFHILAAAILRNPLSADLKIKTPQVALPGPYAHKFNALIGGVATADAKARVGRASRTDATEIPKANLTALMLGGNHREIGKLRDMFLSSLQPETLTEICERTQQVLTESGMTPDSTKLGIFIRNVKPRPNAGGTQDPAGNMTKERFLDVLNAADKAGIRNIVLLGDRPEADWVAGTPWQNRQVQPAAGRQRHAVATAVDADARHLADLTEPWSPHGSSPLFEGVGRQGPRWHVSTTTVHGSGPADENSLQGGYAEQLAIYDQLHKNLGLVGVVGNRSGVIDGPGFMGVPCVQLVSRSAFPQESTFDRLGLLSTIIPSYKVLTLENQAGNRRTTATNAAVHLLPAQSTALQNVVRGVVEQRQGR